MNVLRLLCRVLLIFRVCHDTARVFAANTASTVEATEPISDKCWIFTHLQKNGGSTVKRVLKRRFPHTFNIYDSVQWKSRDAYIGPVGKMLTETNNTVMAGGYTEGLRSSGTIDHKCQWFTMFRHPIPRMVSAYYYCQKRPQDMLCGSAIMHADKVDLLTFAKHWGNFGMRQFALSTVDHDDVIGFSRSDAARQYMPPVDKLWSVPGWYFVKVYLNEQARTSDHVEIPDEAMYEMLQPVQELLRDRYTVGILEEFNTTLSLYNAALDMPGIDWHKEYAGEGNRNVNTKYKEEEHEALVNAWTNAEMKAYMHLDILLYEHAVDVFHQQARAYGLE